MKILNESYVWWAELRDRFFVLLMLNKEQSSQRKISGKVHPALQGGIAEFRIFQKVIEALSR